MKFFSVSKSHYEPSLCRDSSHWQYPTQIRRICSQPPDVGEILSVCMARIKNNLAFHFLQLLWCVCGKVVTAKEALEVNLLSARSETPIVREHVHTKRFWDYPQVLGPMEVCTKHFHCPGNLQLAQTLNQILWSILGGPAEVSEINFEVFNFEFAADAFECCSKVLHLHFSFVDAIVISQNKSDL